MIFNIVIKESKDDKFSVQSNSKNKVHYISSYKDFTNAEEKYVSHSILSSLSHKKLNPSENAVDFINLSLGVYVFDQLVPRKTYGYFNWSRYFKIYLAVADLGKWEEAKIDIEHFLSFLTGDKWELNLRKRAYIYEEYKRGINKIEKVSLLSGGLDSFIGAVDLLEDNTKNIAFVSHHKKGNSGDESIQKKIIKSLELEYPDINIQPNYFFVQAKTDSVLTGDTSQRARSIIFIALGLAVANSYSNEIPIFVPENGLISLNIPLTKTRFGSHSTKTTHPFFINQINKLFGHLGLNNKLINPYRFYTKGEMILKSKNADFIKLHASTTISCSKPGLYIQRFHKNEKHCGHCTPCIIRRAAMKKAKIDSFKGNYVRDVLVDNFASNQTSSRDIIAFKFALERLSKIKRPLIFELLKSGPIPCSAEELNEYIDLYKRGMKEVSDFLNNND
jgi:7-cyano-7-deazaguanine synthase in queuosine biosynthesis